MTNGHIEIYDPIPHPDGRSTGTYHEPESTPDMANMEETVEFRVLVAYMACPSRRRPNTQRSPVTQSGGDDADGHIKTPLKTPTQTENKVTEKKNRKKKRRLKRMLNIFSCTRPQTKDEEDEEEEEQQQQKPMEPGDEVAFRCFHATDEPEKKDEEDEKAREVASRLMELADEIQLIPPEIESDSPDDEVEKIIGLLLRETGDKYDGKVLKDANIAAELFWNYEFFRRLINTFLIRVGLRTPSPNSPGPQASQKTQMAVMCEVTTRLSAVETLPTNRLLNYGARYMQDYFSSWVQEQGGYDAAFDETEEVD
ncbi:myosin III [Sarotherodon galilaeus]